MEVFVLTKQSSILKTLDYNSETKTLVVEFTTGGRYRYTNVDKDKFLSILGSDSLGSEFNKLKVNHEYEKLC